jgi:phosphate-selective porin OprO/OprP
MQPEAKAARVRQLATAATFLHVADGSYDPNVQFGDAGTHEKGWPLSGVGTPPSDRGDTMSWKDFKAATASDEEVRVGGV